jgi:hypothetical protein
MIRLLNLTTNRQSIYDDNQDVIWSTVVGIFVTFRAGRVRVKTQTRFRLGN